MAVQSAVQGKFDKERILALLVLGAGALMLWFLFAPRSTYLRIPTADLEPLEMRYILHGTETYLVLRLSEAHESRYRMGTRPLRELSDTVDPPNKNTQTWPFRVFAIHAYNGLKMLPAKHWWDFRVPCDEFLIVAGPVLVNERILNGGFKCRRSVAP